MYCLWNGSDTVCTAQKAQAEDCNEDLECLSGACDYSYGCLAAAECFVP
jgi:hypothetical protein